MQYMNNLRGFAILMIVFGHAVSTVVDPTQATSMLEFMFGNGTLLFVAIAGFLFAETSDTFEYPTYIRGKIKNVVIPYILISIPGILLYITGLRNNHVWLNLDWFYTLNPIVQVLYLLVTGAHLGPLWFIPTICIFYIVSPLLIVFLKHPVLYLPVFTIAVIAAYVVGRPFHNSNVLISFVYYIPSYLLGIILQRRQQLFKRLGPISPALAIASLLALVVAYFAFEVDHVVNDSITLVFMLPITVITISLFWTVANVKNRWLDLFARLSFFIFFIHGYFTLMYRVLTAKFWTVLDQLRMDGSMKFAGDMVQTAFVFATALFLCLACYVVVRLVLRSHSRYLAAT